MGCRGWSGSKRGKPPPKQQCLSPRSRRVCKRKKENTTVNTLKFILKIKLKLNFTALVRPWLFGTAKRWRRTFRLLIILVSASLSLIIVLWSWKLVPYRWIGKWWWWWGSQGESGGDARYRQMAKTVVWQFTAVCFQSDWLTGLQLLKQFLF